MPTPALTERAFCRFAQMLDQEHHQDAGGPTEDDGPHGLTMLNVRQKLPAAAANTAPAAKCWIAGVGCRQKAGAKYDRDAWDWFQDERL